jgi:hypothetical protein
MDDTDFAMGFGFHGIERRENIQVFQRFIDSSGRAGVLPS